MNNEATPELPDSTFAALSRIVLGEEPLDAILERVMRLAVEVLPLECEASITLVRSDGPTTIAFTAEPALVLDERQYETERGPCLDAAQGGQRLLIRDMAEETRWPRFTEGAVANQIRSSLSVPLPIQRDVTGALNFYATDPDAFSDEAIELAETFAGQAAVAVANAHLYEVTAALAQQMSEAMANRAVIEQAKGIIMRDHGCSPDEAFDVLVRMSQKAHTKLRDIAQRVVDDVTKQ